MRTVDIAMCWDGQTDTAELLINGMAMTGHPEDVQAAFDALCRLRDQAQFNEVRIERAVQAITSALDNLKPGRE